MQKKEQKSNITLVTGGAGFIGSHIVDALFKSGKEVVIVDNFSSGKKLYTPNGVVVESIDLTDKRTVNSILDKYRPVTIHHCAGHTRLREALSAPSDDAIQNVISSLNLLQAILELRAREKYVPKQILFSSSAAVYGGSSKPPYFESSLIQPVTPYGIAKYSVEQYLEWFHQLTDVAVTIFRYANVYGPRQATSGETGVVAKFMHSLVKGKELIIYGDGSHQRDYIYVEDIASAHLIAERKLINGTFNLGTTVLTTTSTLAEKCVALAKRGPKIQIIYKKIMQEEQTASYLDAKKFILASGWLPVTELNVGLQRTMDWYYAKTY